MKNTMLVLAVLAAVVLVAVGCGNTEQQSSGLEGTSWKMVAWSISSQNPADFTLTAEFDSGNITGKSAVNQYSSTYKAEDNGKLELGPVAMTKMAGSEEEMKAEQNYHQLLSLVKKYEVRDGILTLMDENGNQMLIFDKAK